MPIWHGGGRKGLAMSNVPPSKRELSNIEYVYNAARLYSFTLDCAMKLPKRWMFLLTERTVDAAARVLEHAKAANSIYVTCAVDADLRRFHLNQAYCYAQVLASYVDEMFERFPSREDGGGACISQASYLRWVESIDREFKLVKGVMASDKKRFGGYYAKESAAAVSAQLGLFDT